MERYEFQRLSAALHGTLGSYLRDALQEGIAHAASCLPIPRACGVFSSLLIPAWFVFRTAFLVINFFERAI
jgi:hypothetical protein